MLKNSKFGHLSGWGLQKRNVLIAMLGTNMRKKSIKFRGQESKSISRRKFTGF